LYADARPRRAPGLRQLRALQLLERARRGQERHQRPLVEPDAARMWRADDLDPRLVGALAKRLAVRLHDVADHRRRMERRHRPALHERQLLVEAPVDVIPREDDAQLLLAA
jgi:hypothetical protein